jgi:hypothetical protein
MRRTALLCLACVFWLSITREPARSDEPEHTTAKVLAAWKKRREAVRTIDYVAIGENSYFKGSLTELVKEISAAPLGEFPPEDRTFAVRFRFASRLPDKKLRFERQDEYPRGMRDGPPVFGTDYRNYLFDGNQGYEHIPDEHFDPAKLGERQLTVANRVTFSVMIESKDHPFLLAHGFVPVPSRNTTVDDLAAPAAEVPYSLVSSTPRKADGMLVMRSNPRSNAGDHFYEVWVDPKRDYLICRVVMTSGSQTRETTDLTYKGAGDDSSLSEWKFVHWGREGIKWSYKMKVKSATINEDLPDELFVPPMKNRP